MSETFEDLRAHFEDANAHRRKQLARLREIEADPELAVDEGEADRLREALWPSR